MTRALLVLSLTLAAACSESLDTSMLPPIDPTYGATWAYHDEHGFVPGHGESWRSIFINPEARDYVGVGAYPDGAILVKEIRTLRDDNGTPAAGGLRYIAIMRKLREPPEGVPTQGDWVFSTTGAIGDAESHSDSCWQTCHRQAPYDGAFLDYGKVGTDP